MHKQLFKKILATLSIFLLTFCQSPITMSKAETIADLIAIIDEEAITSQDPVKLINLAILNGVDVASIKVNGKSIVDTLTEEQKQQYLLSETTVVEFGTWLSKAKDGLSNGWAPEVVAQYADKAFDTYDTYITSLTATADNSTNLTTLTLSKESIENEIKEYIPAAVYASTEVGDLSGDFQLTMSSYELLTLDVEQIKEIVEVESEIGLINVVEEKTICTSSQWDTNSQPVTSILNGKISKIDGKTLKIQLGNNEMPLTITYEFNKDVSKLNKDLAEGKVLKQGDLITDKYCQFTISCTYGDKNVDIIKLLGPVGISKITQYETFTSDAYDAIRQDYVNSIKYD